MSTCELWDAYMCNYDFLTEVDGYNRNLDDIVRAAEVSKYNCVLDAGSGTGNLSIKLSAAGAKVTSFDFSTRALAIHQQKDPAAKTVNGSLEQKLPFESGCFDCVCCASVLFTLSQAGCKNALAEFHRTLRAGGRLVVTAGSRAASGSKLAAMHFGGAIRNFGPILGSVRGIMSLPRLARVLHYNRRLRALPDWNGVHFFAEGELEAFLSSAGFRVLESKSTYGGCFKLIVGESMLP